MSSTPSVLILGARGRFGLAAVRAFAQAGWQVHAQMRPGRTTDGVLDGWPAGQVHPLALSLDDPAAIARAAAGAQVVVHAVNPVYTQAAWRTEAPALLEAAIAIAGQLKACLMLPGNVYNFGEHLGTELTEATPQTAGTVKGQIRIAMEQRLQRAAAEAALRAVVIRAGDFFGSGSGTWIDQAMVPKLRSGRVTYPGALDVPTAWAYLPDLARAFVAVATRRDALPAFETLHFGGYQLTGQDWVDALTDIAWEQGWLPAGGRLKVGTLPWPLIRLGSLFNPVWAALLEMRYLWQRPHRLANHKLCALIGEEPHTPFAQAARDTLASLGMLKAPLGVSPSSLPRQAALVSH